MNREEAIEVLKEFKVFCEGILWDSKYIGRVEAIDKAIEALKDRPTAVLCKDCFWFDQNIYRNCFRNRSEDEYAEWGVCTKLSHNMKVNDYCSCGEREAPYKGGDTE